MLQEESITAAIAGASAAEDFGAVCAALGIDTPHPAVTKALAHASTFSLRGWQADLPSLCALLAVLSKHAGLSTAKFWSCGLDAAAISLLTSALPESIETLAVEGGALTDEDASLASLASLPKVSRLSLRCAELSGVPAPLAASLGANESLTSLSLFGNPIGDGGVATLCAALRTNAALLTLDLGRCKLTDASCESLLLMCTEEPAPPPAEEPPTEGEPAAAPSKESGGEAVEGDELSPALPEPVPPNRSLSSLNLCYNAIGTPGRSMLEQCQALSPGLARVELVGNPCLTCGPTASLGVEARQAIASSWQAIAELEGGSQAVCKSVVVAALTATPEVLPLVGYEAPPTPRPPVDEEGNPIEEPPPAEGEAAEPVNQIELWAGLDGLSARVTKAIDGLVGSLGQPEALNAQLAGDYGVLLASRGVPAGLPFEAFGEALLSGLSTALAEGLTEEAANAWRDAYTDASASLQEAYTPSQLAEAAAKAAAKAAAAESEEEAAAAEE